MTSNNQQEHQNQLTSNHNTRIQRLRLDHLLSIHTHQIPQKHARRMRKRFMDANSRKFHRQPATQMHASLGGLDKLRHIGMAGVETGECVDDADYGP